ncbi:cytosolic purine 5'-nucleotidase isoform X2 [Aplysia californica]|uniref:Cytosolic purine 5'-nucleotidase isoform X2 n=1 Tax=Aplysia californica TaxID=6500 RepID=A0ABM0ZXD6_APLCA|nr:cytosolic purine 5'-nucleotidase isoform X2 [Aplysia californica]
MGSPVISGLNYEIRAEIQALYPTKFVQMEEGRYRIFNTLYELPLIYILACLIDYFNNSSDYVQTANGVGVKVGDLTMTYESIYNDVNTAMEHVHHPKGPLKTDTMSNVEKYVVKDDRLPLILTRLRDHDKKVFLATNSDYKYTNIIMNYLFDTKSNPEKKPWTDFFDFIVVDSKKPLFFSQGTVIREVNKDTGDLRLGTFTGKVRPGVVYSGGSSDMISEMMGTQRSEVLYVGDHIFGDILKSKKKQGWRTFLIVPEMVQELTVWTAESNLFSRLSFFDHQIAEMYRNLDSSDNSKPDITEIHKNIREVTHKMDQAYGKLGSVFRSGSRQTFFASQVMRYADLYAPSFSNMLHYPLTYCFRAPSMLMPHESTVDHDSTITEEQLREISRVWRSHVKEADKEKRNTLQRSDSNVPRLFCSSPRQLTEVADDFLDESVSGTDSATE